MKPILKLWIPLSAFALASAGAMTTSLSNDDVTKPLITGWINHPSGNCLARLVDCTLVNTGFTCMSSDATPQQVFAKDAVNMCTINLYKVIH